MWLALHLIVFYDSVLCGNVVHNDRQHLVHVEEFDKPIGVLGIGADRISPFDFVYYLAVNAWFCSKYINRHENVLFKWIFEFHVGSEQVL